MGCTTVNAENYLGAIHFANNPATNLYCKHINVCYYFLRERVASGELKLTHVQSDQQHTDFLTKPLAREAFCAHRNFVTKCFGIV